MKRRITISVVLGTIATFSSIFDANVFAHSSGNAHVVEMYSVLPFKSTQNVLATKENIVITDWLGMITSV